MNECANRYVAHLDILGMASIVEKDADRAWLLLSDLVAVREQTGAYEIEFLESKEKVRIPDMIHEVTFSDTILLFTKSDSPIELRCMIVRLTEMFHKAMLRGIPVRVGLSFGKFYFNLDKSMYAGPAFIEAYRIGEAAQWLGIALSESVQEKAVSLEMASGGSKVVVQWALPLKNGSRMCFVINWPALFAHDLKVKPPISVTQFYQAYESTYGAFENLSPKDRAKYENTVNFMNHLLQKHAAA